MATDTAPSIAAYLKEHPRMMGVLFTMSLLLMHAGNAMANAASANSGP